MRFNGAILALDLATQTGWAYGRPGETPLFGSIRWDGKDRPTKYRSFRAWLGIQTQRHPTDLIVFESAAAATTMSGRTTMDTIKLLVGLCEHLEEWSLDRVELREARVSDVRAHFIGGNPKRDVAKAKTMQKCRDYGWDVKNDDEADALALWCFQIAHLRPDIAAKMTPLFAFGRPVINK